MSKIPESAIHKELDLIQGCIVRMSHNSFIIKGWDVLLFSGAFIFWESHPQKGEIFPVVAGSIIILWVLDAYFLQQERNFRQLYAWVIKARKNGKDDNLYNLDCKKINCNSCILKALFSPVMFLLYIVPLIFVVCLVFGNYNIKITPKSESAICQEKPTISAEKNDVLTNSITQCIPQQITEK